MTSARVPSARSVNGLGVERLADRVGELELASQTRGPFRDRFRTRGSPTAGVP